jgi:hypothetical protein
MKGNVHGKELKLDSMVAKMLSYCIKLQFCHCCDTGTDMLTFFPFSFLHCSNLILKVMHYPTSLSSYQLQNNHKGNYFFRLLLIIALKIIQLQKNIKHILTSPVSDIDPSLILMIDPYSYHH